MPMRSPGSMAFIEAPRGHAHGDGIRHFEMDIIERQRHQSVPAASRNLRQRFPFAGLGFRGCFRAFLPGPGSLHAEGGNRL